MGKKPWYEFRLKVALGLLMTWLIAMVILVVDHAKPARYVASAALFVLLVYFAVCTVYMIIQWINPSVPDQIKEQKEEEENKS